MRSRFGLPVSCNPLTLAGCPLQSIVGRDVHNDLEAARLFNPRYVLEPRFDDVGLNLFQLLFHDSSNLFSICFMYDFFVILFQCLIFHRHTRLVKRNSWNWIQPYPANCSSLVGRSVTLVQPDEHRFLTALSMSSWTASQAFTINQLIENSICAFYLVVLLVMWAHKRRGTAWDQVFMAKVTTRNLYRMLAHAILRFHSWPASACYEPSLCMEDSIERWFGRVKTCKRLAGSLTTANSIQAAHLLHLMDSMSGAYGKTVFWIIIQHFLTRSRTME